MIKCESDIKFMDHSAVTLDTCPSFSGIVAGVCKGELWVDDGDRPALALVYSRSVGGYAFFGNLHKEGAYE